MLDEKSEGTGGVVRVGELGGGGGLISSTVPVNRLETSKAYATKRAAQLLNDFRVFTIHPVFEDKLNLNFQMKRQEKNRWYICSNLNVTIVKFDNQ